MSSLDMFNCCRISLENVYEADKYRYARPLTVTEEKRREKSSKHSLEERKHQLPEEKEFFLTDVDLKNNDCAGLVKHLVSIF